MQRARRVAKRALSLVDRALASSAHGEPPDPGALPAVFIVGGPRSGSTLLYQAWVRSRRFAYLNNVSARFPRSAHRVARLLAMQRWEPPASFRSEYGDTRGRAAPSEAGDFWDHAFPWRVHHGVEPEDLDDSRVAALRAVVSGLVELYGAPFLAKNLWHSVRIPALDAILPAAVFVVLRRDPLLMAQSLLEARRRRLGEAPGFWSIRPREIVPLEHLPPVEHTAHQLAATYRAIDAARRRLGEERFVDVDYEAFCAAPAAGIAALDAFLERRGWTLEERAPLETTFAASRELRLPPDEIERLETIFREQWPGGYPPGPGARTVS